MKCAVIGMGLLGTQHASYLAKHDSTDVAAVCDIKLEKAQEWAKENNCPAYSDVKKMLSEIKPELVVVATQDPYHKDPIIAACEAKVPYIISEKPLATTISDAKEIAAAAKASGTEIKVLFPTRFYPLDQAVRILLREGYLGQAQYGEMRLDDSISVPLRLWGDDSKQYAKISSPAFFLLSHAVDLLNYYFGPKKIAKVYAIGKQGVIGSSVDYADSFLTFDDGLTIRLKTEWTKRLEGLVENYAQLTASKGGFVFNKSPAFGCTAGLRVSLDGDKENAEKAAKLLEDNGIHCEVKAYNDDKNFALELFSATPGNDFDWNMGICHYADSFMGKENPKSPVTLLEGGLYQVCVVDAILKSAERGREVMVEYI